MSLAKRWRAESRNQTAIPKVAKDQPLTEDGMDNAGQYGNAARDKIKILHRVSSLIVRLLPARRMHFVYHAVRYGTVIVAFAIATVNTFWYGTYMEERKTRHSWLDAGLQALASEGPDGLRIMLIAEKLGVTKGSFYWHFKNLAEYQLAVLGQWEHSHTEQIIERVEHAGGNARAKLYNLATTVTSDFSLGRAIRSWSLANQDVSQVQARVDQKRIEYTAKLLREAGWSKDEALTAGRWAYCGLIGHSVLSGPPMTEKQIKLILATLVPR